MFMLPPGEFVFLQIPHPSERRVRPATEKQPADVRVEKTPVDVIGILLVIHMLVVAAVVSRPPERRTLESRRAKKQGVKFHDRTCLKSQVREEAMVAERNAHACGYRKKQK